MEIRCYAKGQVRGKRLKLLGALVLFSLPQVVLSQALISVFGVLPRLVNVATLVLTEPVRFGLTLYVLQSLEGRGDLGCIVRFYKADVVGKSLLFSLIVVAVRQLLLLPSQGVGWYRAQAVDSAMSLVTAGEVSSSVVGLLFGELLLTVILSLLSQALLLPLRYRYALFPGQGVGETLRASRPLSRAWPTSLFLLRFHVPLALSLLGVPLILTVFYRSYLLGLLLALGYMLGFLIWYYPYLMLAEAEYGRRLFIARAHVEAEEGQTSRTVKKLCRSGPWYYCSLKTGAVKSVEPLCKRVFWRG